MRARRARVWFKNTWELHEGPKGPRFLLVFLCLGASGDQFPYVFLCLGASGGKLPSVFLMFWDFRGTNSLFCVVVGVLRGCVLVRSARGRQDKKHDFTLAASRLSQFKRFAECRRPCSVDPCLKLHEAEVKARIC